eukprot:8855496-Pyramimonas_sp.AAC.1
MSAIRHISKSPRKLIVPPRVRPGRISRAPPVLLQQHLLVLVRPLHLVTVRGSVADAKGVGSGR